MAAMRTRLAGQSDGFGFPAITPRGEKEEKDSQDTVATIIFIGL